MTGFAEGYIDVATRLAEFYAKYPEGSLQTDSPVWEDVDGQRFLSVTAYAYRTPDDPRPGMGRAWEVVPGRTPYTRGSELMNAETSAWGRALAALGIATRQGIASAQEVRGAQERQGTAPPGLTGPAARAYTADVSAASTTKQHGMIRRLMDAHGLSEALLPDAVGITTPADGLASLTKHEASALIDALMALPKDRPVIRDRYDEPPDDPWATAGGDS